jgi:hypothetical protein
MTFWRQDRGSAARRITVAPQGNDGFAARRRWPAGAGREAVPGLVAIDDYEGGARHAG